MPESAKPDQEQTVPASPILVVDPDPHSCGLMARILTPRHGFDECVVSRTLAEAQERLRRQSFALVFVDLNLRDSRGIATLAAVRALAGDAQVLVLTSVTDETLGLQAMREGAHDYLVKGHLGPDALRRTARYALERHKAGRALRRSQDLLAASLDALPACVAILDAEHRVLMTNSRWREEPEGGSPLIHGCGEGCDYLQRVRDHVGAEEAGEVLDVLEGRARTCSLDYPVASGPKASWYELRVEVFHQHGLTHFLVAHMGITARKLLEMRLKASQDLFTLITQNVIDLVSLIDANGRRIFTSPSYQRQLGYTAEEMRRFGVIDIIHPEDRSHVELMLEKVFLGDTLAGLSYRILCKDGGFRTYEANAVAVPRAFGQPPRALLVSRDITERLEAEAEHASMEIQLRHAQKLEAIGQLAAGIAHEINTPIQYVGDNTIFLRDAFRDLTTFLQDLQDRTRDGGAPGHQEISRSLEDLDMAYLVEEIPKAIQQTLEGVGRVSRIVSAMKDFSHPDGSQRERVDLNRAIESTITVSRNAWKYCATLEADLDPDLPPVPCFPGEFNQAVLNLLVNAAHAIEERRAAQGLSELGRISVSTRRAGDQVQVRVSDTGTGIPEAIRQRIFDPFFTTKPVGKGTGQGLSIVRAVVVDKHGGTVSLDSEPGKGTAFLLTLPLEVRP